MKVNQIKQYLISNWFKVALIVIAVMAFMQKDFSLSFNLQRPIETVDPQEVEPAIHVKKEKPQRITQVEKKAALPVQKSGSFLDNFSLPFFGKGKTTSTSTWKNVTATTRQAYIDRFVHVARSEQEKFGIPASIILGNALLQSDAGQKQVAKNSNNHFLLPCSADWMGAQKLTKAGCYRAYESAWFSFRDHSTFLQNGGFEQLQRYGTDYKAWAQGMVQLGYPYSGDLAKDLIEVIEAHNLHRYDF